MTTTVKPPLRETIPGVTRPYRLYTKDYVDFDTFYGVHPLVVTDGWGTSQIIGKDEPVVLNVYRVPVDIHADRSHDHPLNRTMYPERVDASRAVFDAGITGFMVYLDKETDQ